MLRGLIAIVLALLILGGVPAAADQTCIREQSGTGVCLAWVDVPVAHQGNADGADPKGEGGPNPQARTCSFAGREVACTRAEGTWSDLVQAWCRAQDPQPPSTDPAWNGNSDGAIYLCVRPNGSLIPDPGMAFTRWLPAAPDAVTRADAEAAARRVLASLGLTAIDLGIHPRGDTVDRMGYVGWHMWLWAESPSDRQWGPVEARATDSGVSVSLSARVAEVTWEMGNGDSLACQRGTAWSESRTQGGRNVASPDCGYVYAEDGRYTVTATSEWAVDWSAAGYTGTLPLTLSRSADVIVGELQSVAVGG